MWASVPPMRLLSFILSLIFCTSSQEQSNIGEAHHLVFLGGMPHSGTTLTGYLFETAFMDILSGHQDEGQYMQNVYEKAAGSW